MREKNVENLEKKPSDENDPKVCFVFVSDSERSLYFRPNWFVRIYVQSRCRTTVFRIGTSMGLAYSFPYSRASRVYPF